MIVLSKKVVCCKGNFDAVFVGQRLTVGNIFHYSQVHP